MSHLLRPKSFAALSLVLVSSGLIAIACSSDESRIVKTFSMQALAELAEDDARLRARVVTIGEDISKTGGPAMRTRGRKLLDRLNEANR